MPYLEGMRKHRDSQSLSVVKSSQQTSGVPASGSNGKVAKSQWTTAARRDKDPDARKTRPKTLIQDKLAFPGEAGNGIATYKIGANNTASSSKVASSSSNLGKTISKSGNKNLNSFFAPSQVPTSSSQSKSTKRKRPQSSSSRTTPLLLQPSTTSLIKGKGRVTSEPYVVEDDSQDRAITSPLQHEPQQSLRHMEVTVSSSPGPNLRSERSLELIDDGNIGGEHATESGDGASTLWPNLPPMPAPLPQTGSTSIFGFGVKPEIITDVSVKSAKRKRAVIESSSPVKVLAIPSSSAQSVRVAPKARIEALLSVCEPAAPATKGALKVTRQLSREPWDSDDESERKRLNRTESQIVADDLIPKRRPREAVSATMEVTDYMAEYTSETYSPLQNTHPASLMDEFRQRLGLSPAKRQPAARQEQVLPAKINVVSPIRTQRQVMMANELTDGKAMSLSPTMEDSFDESATQYSTYTSSPSKTTSVALRTNSKADDSGFAGSSPEMDRLCLGIPNHVSLSRIPTCAQQEDELAESYREKSAPIGSRKVLAYRQFLASPVKCTIDDQSSQDSRRQGSHLARLEKRSQKAQQDLLSSQEESDFDESTIVRKPRQILALASQETEAVETQEVCVEDTQMVLSSQQEAEEELELELELDMDLDMKTNATEPKLGLPSPKVVTSRAMAEGNVPLSRRKVGVLNQISAAWNPRVLDSMTAEASSKANQHEQSTLTDFFIKKPNGPAERAEAERITVAKNLAEAVRAQQATSRSGEPADEERAALLERADVDDIQMDDEDFDNQDKQEVGEVADSDEEEGRPELASQIAAKDQHASCEDWVVGRRQVKTPTPVKRYRKYRIKL